jgi:hypothetical protein
LKQLRRHLSYANVAATLALALALGGASAFAATQLAKNSVGTKQLRKNAVTGAKVKNGSLSGADIKGSVASATHAGSADTATNATNATHAGSADNAATLGGQPASAFVAGSQIQRTDWEPLSCGVTPCETTLFSAKGMALSATCSKDLVFTIPSTIAGGTLTIWGESLSGGASFGSAFGATAGTKPLELAGAGADGVAGTVLYRSPQGLLSWDFVASKGGNGQCAVFGTLTVT